MMDRWSRGAFVAVGLIACAGAMGQTAKADLKQKIEAKKASNAVLADKAKKITNDLGELAKSGNLPTSDDAIALMRKMVEELAGIREELKKQDEELETLYKATGVAKPGATAKAQDKSMDDRLTALEKVKISGYEQAQYRNSNLVGKTEDAFYSKRSRINLEYRPDNKMVGFKASFDLSSAPVSTGSSSSSTLGLSGKDNNSSLTKDAYVHWAGNVPGSNVKTDLMIGQYSIPFGYELPRSDADREFPERSLFNDSQFKGQRGRGVNLAFPMANGLTIQGGFLDSLTTEDPEQLGYAAGSHGRLTGIANITKKQSFKNKNGKKTDVELGLSGLDGTRPTFAGVSATSPQIVRRYGEASLVATNLFGQKIDWRSEVMVGKDRVPNANPASALPATNMSGWSSILGFRFGNYHRIDLKWDQFNPNLNVTGKTLNEKGLAYNLTLGQYRLTVAKDFVEDENPANGKYSVTTVRAQIRF